MIDNPYQTPQSDIFSGNTYAKNDGGVSAGVINELYKTKGWVRFLSVLGFIGSGFYFLAIILYFIGAGVMASKMADELGPIGVAGGLFVGIFYIIIGIIFTYPTVRMWKYASRINFLIYSERVEDLEDALAQQRSIWRFNGILALIGLILFAGGLIAGMVIPAIAAVRGMGM